MNSWLRRTGAALRMGLTWAIAWFGASMALLLIGLVFGATADVPFPILFGVFGFLAGTAFSGVLGFFEGRRRFDQMSLPRFAGWGAAGGLLLSAGYISVAALVGHPTPLSNLEVVIPVFTLAGAGSAAGVLAIARRAEERELLDASEDVGEVGLSEDEAQTLLGGGG